MLLKMARKYTIKYQGGSKISAIDLANSIFGFARAMELISKDCLEKNTQLVVSVQTFKEGSVEINTIVEVAQIGVAIGQIAYGTTSSLEIVDNCVSIFTSGIGLLKHLKGSKPTDIKTTNTGELVVTNAEGVSQQFNAKTMQYIGNNSFTNCVINFVSPAKNSPDVEGISMLEENRDVMVNVAREEALSMQEVSLEDISVETELFGYVNSLSRNKNDGTFYAGGNNVEIKLKKILHSQKYMLMLANSLALKSLIKIYGTCTYTGDLIIKRFEIDRVEESQKSLELS